MADKNPKRIKLEPNPEPEPAAPLVTPTRADLSQEVKQERQKVDELIKRQIKLNEDLLQSNIRLMDMERELGQGEDGGDAIRAQNQELTAERDSLVLQLQQEVSKTESLRTVLVQHLQSPEAALKNQELIAERDSLLQQLQQEMSKSEALRQKLLETEQSHQAVMDSVQQHHASRVQELALRIEELGNECSFFHDEMHDLTERLEQITEENSCCICMSPWEAQGAHRLVSLRCGHLFGESCISQCLRNSAECPACKQAARPSDLRLIFGCRILSVPHRQQAPQAVQGAPERQSRRRQPAPAPAAPPVAQPASHQQLPPAPPVAQPALRQQFQPAPPVAQPASRQQLQTAPPVAQPAPHQQVQPPPPGAQPAPRPQSQRAHGSQPQQRNAAPQVQAPPAAHQAPRQQLQAACPLHPALAAQPVRHQQVQHVQPAPEARVDPYNNIVTFRNV